MSRFSFKYFFSEMKELGTPEPVVMNFRLFLIWCYRRNFADMISGSEPALLRIQQSAILVIYFWQNE